MTSPDDSNIRLLEVDDPNIIDVNKPDRRKEQCEILERRLLNSRGFLCRQIYSNNSTLKNNTLTNSIAASSDNSPGKFDYVGIACIKDIIDFFNKYKESLRDYDLIVMNTGVWEGLMIRTCLMLVNTTRGTRRLKHGEKSELFLDTLSNLSSPDLQVVYRTPGFSIEHEGDEIMWDQVNRAKNYAARLKQEAHQDIKQQTKNFTVVDWGTVISKRSYGDERIHGDMDPHYGLEGRLLYVQQLLHELLASEQIRSN